MTRQTTETPWGARYQRLFRITSVARPLSADYPTNRAVLWLVPTAAVLAAIAGRVTGVGDAGSMALAAAGVAFGAWALARELAPDDNPAAFVAMGLALATLFIEPAPSLGLLFVALFLARIVNRSTGLPARPGDSIVVTALAVAVAWQLAQPLLAAVAAVAFLLDAVLRHPLRRQFVFAGAALAGAIFVARNGWPSFDRVALDGTGAWLAALAVLAYLWRLLRTRRVRSVADVTGAPLDTARIKGAMLVALLVAGQSLSAGNEGLALAAPLFATLAGVASTTWRVSVPDHQQR